jgi:hypothetical protein
MIQSTGGSESEANGFNTVPHPVPVCAERSVDPVLAITAAGVEIQSSGGSFVA